MTPVRNLDPIEFDLLEGQARPAGLSQAVMPVTALPLVEFDLASSRAITALAITLEMKPTADPARVALDVLSLIDELQRYDRRLGGEGIHWDRSRSNAESGGTVRIVLTPNAPEGAEERMAKIAEFVTGPQREGSATHDKQAESILRFEAVLIRIAA
jgi:hypothetical protein